MKNVWLTKIQVLDGTVLKIIAMISMVFDHLGDIFFPELVWMRIIGRLAMPIFAFCISEGYIHTRNKGKYLLRLGVFALVSEVPFDLAIFGKVEFTHQNIMLTFFLTVLALILFEKITERKKAIWYILGVMVVMMVAVVSLLLCTDYNAFALGLVFVFFLLRNKSHVIRNMVAFVYHILMRNVGIYLWGILSFILLMMYNGKKGKGLKWLFYGFYPGHLLILYLMKCLL